MNSNQDVYFTDVANTGAIAVRNNSFLHTSGTIDNSGSITLNSAGNNTDLHLSADTTLTGSGTVILASNNASRIAADTIFRLTNADNLIQGFGQVGVNSITISNQGTIDANVSDQTLVVDPANAADAFVNTGTLQASGGGTLLLSGNGGGAFTNDNGLIQALDGSEVQLNANVSITGGILTTAGDGVIRAINNQNVYLTNLTNAGTFVVNNNTFVHTAGTITNTGIFTLNSGGNNTDFRLAADTTLNGGGTLTLAGNTASRISGDDIFRLTNMDNLIQGFGQIGVNSIAVTNQSLILANVDGQILTIDPANVANAFLNTGTLRASGGGILLLTGNGDGAFANSNGLIEALADSEVQLANNVSIVGGILSTTDNGLIRVINNQNVYLTDLTNAGAFIVNNNATVHTAGTITNTGTFTLNSGGNNTDLRLAADTMLTGAGIVSLTAPNSRISGDDFYRLRNFDNLIHGFGQIGVNSIAMTNQSVIAADVHGTTLTIDPAPEANVIDGGPSFLNQGTLEATGGGILLLTGNGGGAFTNTAHVIKAFAGSEVQLNANVSIIGGTLATADDGVIRTLDNQNVYLTDLTNAGTFIVNNNAAVHTAGTITNTGTFTLNSVGNNTDFRLAADTTLIGGGTLTLAANNNNRIAGDDFYRLTNVDNLIQGFGQVGANSIAITNQSLISADVNGTTLTIDPAPEANVIDGGPSFLNQGTLEATGGGILLLTGNGGGAFTNTGHTIQALAGSQVQLTSNVSITGGTLATAADGVIRTLDNQNVYLTDLTNAGTFVVNNNATVRTAGTITNTGTFTLNSGGNNTDFRLAAATMLRGAGTLTLAMNNASRIVGDNFYRLMNVDNLIEGFGQIGADSIAITNQSLISANVAGQTLVIDPAAEGNVIDGGPSFLNQGILQATGGGMLLLTGSGGGAFTNTGHVIEALDGSEVQLTTNVSISGGTFTTVGSGVIRELDNQNAYITNLANTGAIVVNNNASLHTSGAIVNSGTITLNSGGNITELRLSADTTLTGGGTVTLALNDASRIAGDGLFRLTNVDNLIQGRGQLGANSITITNQALIDANVTGQTLTIDPANAANAFINSGTLRASNGGILLLTGSGAGDFTNTGHTIQALAGSEVQLTTNVSITGGTLTTAGDGVIRALDGQNVYLTNLTNAGTFIVNNNTSVHTAGTITNTGTFTLNSGGNITDFRLAADTTLNGGGTLTLAGNVASRISGDNIFRLTNMDNTIQGFGQVGANSIALTNQSLILANVAGQTLTIDPANVANAFLNTGILRATGGGILLLTGSGAGDFTNSNGLIEALANSEVQLTTNVSITGGILSTTGNGVIRELDGQNVYLTDLTNAGAIVVNNNSLLHTSGTITNSGSITLNSGGNDTDLRLATDTTLNGGGTLTLSGNVHNRISGDSIFRLTNMDNIIQGFGQVGANSITIDNQGTIDANVMSQTLTIDPANAANAFVNEASGLVRASNGGILLLSGNGSGSFDNRGTLAATTGGELQFTGTVTSSGAVDVGNNSLSISGNGNFTQSAGTFRLAGGTVTSSNGLTFNGGLVDARGTINSAITNSAILRPALGGSGLNVTGNVSLLSASQLSFQLGGLTQGSQYGFLNVNGTVALGGQLVLSFANGFQNSVTGSDTFTLMTTNGLNGSFTNIASGSRLQTVRRFRLLPRDLQRHHAQSEQFHPWEWTDGSDCHLAPSRGWQLDDRYELEQQPEFPQ